MPHGVDPEAGIPFRRRHTMALAIVTLPTRAIAQAVGIVRPVLGPVRSGPRSVGTAGTQVVSGSPRRLKQQGPGGVANASAQSVGGYVLSRINRLNRWYGAVRIGPAPIGRRIAIHWAATATGVRIAGSRAILAAGGQRDDQEHCGQEKPTRHIRLRSGERSRELGHSAP